MLYEKPIYPKNLYLKRAPMKHKEYREKVIKRQIRAHARPGHLGHAHGRVKPTMSNTSPTALLLNVGHAMDHLFLLIFATAVSTIALQWGMAWQDLMPYTVGAFVMFGLGSLPAGRLGDLWGRRAMMSSSSSVSARRAWWWRPPSGPGSSRSRSPSWARSPPSTIRWASR